MTKHIFHIMLVIFVGLSTISSCSDDELEEEVHIKRTVIAYITGDNNISSNLLGDIKEMISGSANLPSDCRLVIFSDCKNSNPYIAEIKNGEEKVVYQYESEMLSTSVTEMKNAMQWIVDTYPSDEYALIMSGHGTGSLIIEDTVAYSSYIRLYAYGWDDKDKDKTYNEYNGKWINIPSLATVFSNLTTRDGNRLHFEYIFFDCCCMQTAETAYELRKYTDYIIAAASEVPGKGAPYKSIVPVLGDDKSIVGASIINKYISGTSWDGTGGIAISAVKTDEMESLLNITRDALHELYTGGSLELKRDNCIYYYRGDESNDTPVLYDFQNIMLNNLSTERYQQWLVQYNKTVVEKYVPIADRPWHSVCGSYNQGVNFYSFTVSENNCGCMGFFFPYAPYDNTEIRVPPRKSLNKTMFDYEWVRALGWHDMGW